MHIRCGRPDEVSATTHDRADATADEPAAAVGVTRSNGYHIPDREPAVTRVRAGAPCRFENQFARNVGAVDLVVKPLTMLNTVRHEGTELRGNPTRKLRILLFAATAHPMGVLRQPVGLTAAETVTAGVDAAVKASGAAA